MKKFARILCLTLVAVMLVATLASCAAPNKDPKKAKAALEEEGYVVILNDTALLLPDDVEATLSATNGDDYIRITYYKESGDAKDAWKDAEDEIKEMKEKDEDLIIKKSGKMIWVGTKAAVKAAG
ncbi:MAG: hypothetical protein E7590_08020 [Ruminococcaceae bacterium]|nr:hypothetical protein [Oscillospiraceae bacterium]